MTLRITLEIVPHGNEYLKYPIEVINISNLGQLGDTNTDWYGYVVEHNQYKEYDDKTPRLGHRRNDGAIILARKALQKIE